MPIIATAGESKSYTPAPEGTHQGVCVDVIDLGLLPDTFNPGKVKHKVNIVWQIDESRDDGKRHQLYKRYTLSLNEKATLRKDLESWRGRVFTLDEEMGFDVEKLMGANCLLNVQHKKSVDGTRTYANVIAVMPLIKGMQKLFPLDYERQTPETAAQQEPEQDHAPCVDEITDDQIPF
jgi:hypothetical protein